MLNKTPKIQKVRDQSEAAVNDYLRPKTLQELGRVKKCVQL